MAAILKFALLRKNGEVRGLMPGRVRLAVCDLAPDWDPARQLSDPGAVQRRLGAYILPEPGRGAGLCFVRHVRACGAGVSLLPHPVFGRGQLAGPQFVRLRPSASRCSTMTGATCACRLTRCATPGPRRCKSTKPRPRMCSHARGSARLWSATIIPPRATP